MQIHYTPKDVQRFWNKVDKSGGPDACWLWTASCRRGYGQIGIGGKGGAILYSHRVSYELAYGPIQNGLFVCHKCDNPGCVNPTHLFLGTQGQNLDDMRKKERGARGESHGRRKLSDSQIAEIRQRYTFRGIGGEKLSSLANEFGVSLSQISRIASRKSRP